MIRIVHPRTWIVWICLAVVTSGCDERVVEIAREAADRQAQQNQVMARLQQQVAEGSQGLVEADAAARRDYVTVQHDLHAERQSLDKARADLDAERQALASDRHTESLLTALIPMASGAAMLVALLLFLRQVLQQSADGVEGELTNLLLIELVGPPADGSSCHLGNSLSAPFLPSSEQA